MKARRWWQRRCPYRWYDRDEHGKVLFGHTHYCRLEGTGEPHTHVCDCGAVTGRDVCQPIEEDDASGDWGYLCRRSDLAGGDP